MLIELGLGGLECPREVIVIERRVDDCVSVAFKLGRLDAAWDGMPAVKEEDSHDNSASWRASEINIVSGSLSAPACRSMLTTCAAV